MTTDIYEQHGKAFARVSAWVILKDGERVATVAIKYPADGAGRLWAYTHFLGAPMTRGYAGGYGYDKATPAVQSGFSKTNPRDRSRAAALTGRDEYEARTLAALQEFRAALNSRDGYYWYQNLEAAGYAVLQAV